VSRSSWRSLATGDDAFLRGIADGDALGNDPYTKGVPLPVELVTAIDLASARGQPGSSSATEPGGFGAADGVGNECMVQILSRLLALDKGEAMSGVEADEEIGTHPDTDVNVRYGDRMSLTDRKTSLTGS